MLINHTIVNSVPNNWFVFICMKMGTILSIILYKKIIMNSSNSISNILYDYGGLLASMGQNPFCYTKAYELVGKGVGTGLIGSHCRLACAQAKHAQGLDRTKSDAAS